MDFEKILDQWDNNPTKKKKIKKQNDLNSWIDKYPIEDKDKDLQITNKTYNKKINFKKFKIQDEIDLHGLIVSEAELSLDKFIKASYKKGLIKVLVIHGKGVHSQGKAVIKEFVKKYLVNNKLIKSFYTADNANGGSGATCVILKNK